MKYFLKRRKSQASYFCFSMAVLKTLKYHLNLSCIALINTIVSLWIFIWSYSSLWIIDGAHWRADGIKSNGSCSSKSKKKSSLSLNSLTFLLTFRIWWLRIRDFFHVGFTSTLWLHHVDGLYGCRRYGLKSPFKLL